MEEAWQHTSVKQNNRVDKCMEEQGWYWRSDDDDSDDDDDDDDDDDNDDDDDDDDDNDDSVSASLYTECLVSAS